MWQEVIWLIEDPGLITAELDCRLDAARASEPTKKRQDAVERDLTRVGKGIERLLTAYQEDLLSLDELRRAACPNCGPANRDSEPSCRRSAIRPPTACHSCGLAETLTAFLQRLQQSAETVDIGDRQRVARLLVKEVLVDDDTITIRHSIPAQPTTPPTGSEPPSGDFDRLGVAQRCARLVSA